MLMLSLQQGLKLEEATLAAEHALLTAPSTAQSGISPFFLQHGYDPLGGFDSLLSENRVAFNASATLESHLKSLRVARLIALLATEDYQRRADQNDNGRWVRHNFKIGDSVYGLSPKKHGLDVPAYGLFITQFDPIQKSVAWAADPNDRRNVFRLHVSRLVKLGEVPEELRVAMVPFADVFGDRDAIPRIPPRSPRGPAVQPGPQAVRDYEPPAEPQIPERPTSPPRAFVSVPVQAEGVDDADQEYIVERIDRHKDLTDRHGEEKRSYLCKFAGYPLRPDSLAEWIDADDLALTAPLVVQDYESRLAAMEMQNRRTTNRTRGF